MKKFILISLVAVFCTNAYAQDVNSKEGQQEKKSTDIKVKEPGKAISLDGRSFNITFAEKQAEVKPAPQPGVTTDKTHIKSLDKPVSDYSMFDANSKVMLTFSDGKILSPIFVDDGCAYRINTSGNDMYAFSSYCILNSGNKKVNEEATVQDTKMEIDAANTNKPAGKETETPDIMNAPVTAPPDETKQHLPPGVARDDNAEMNTPPAGNVPTPGQSENIQRQAEPPVTNTEGSMATIGGIVNGNAIQGTLSWTETDGKKISYTFSGSAATKKDVNDSRVVGMK